MNRRQSLKLVLAGGALASLPVTWLAIPKSSKDMSFSGIISLLWEMNTKSVRTNGSWSWAKILTHCAQSIELSMTGFPQHKSELFKSIVGGPAFKMFRAKHRMTHSLDDIIPGAEEIPDNPDVQVAMLRFIESMSTFKSFDGTLAPHFAYGPLSKQDYELAHAMHFYNHLNEVEVV